MLDIEAMPCGLLAESSVNRHPERKDQCADADNHQAETKYRRDPMPKSHLHLDRSSINGGNRGTQFYETPATTDLTTGAWTVLVWCETFDVPVAHATPTA